MTSFLAFVESTGQALGEDYGGWLGRFNYHQWQTRTEPWVPVGRTNRPDFPAWGPYEAIPNGTCAAALADLDNVFAALADPIDLALVSLGINDGAQAGFQWPAQPNTYTMVQPLTDLLVGIHQRAAVPILVTTIPVCVGTASQVTYTALWNLYLARAANEARKLGANVWLMDIWAQLNAHRAGQSNDWLLPDGIHPTVTGYERAAEDAIAWFDAHREQLGLGGN